MIPAGGRKRVPWKAAWWDAAEVRRVQLWRGVEAQHVAATMKLVDSVDEQDMLEHLLENSKPPLPPAAASMHYLLATPFRYPSPHASRFRRGGSLGIWYGAESVETTCTELAYWGWRFLMDSDGLRDGELITEFTVFPARVEGVAIDLSAEPWDRHQARWTADDYADCHVVADAARERGVEWLRYWSARHVAGHCGAVLEPTALNKVDLARQQTWRRKVTRQSAFMVHDDQAVSLTFDAHGKA